MPRRPAGRRSPGPRSPSCRVPSAGRCRRCAGTRRAGPRRRCSGRAAGGDALAVVARGAAGLGIGRVVDEGHVGAATSSPVPADEHRPALEDRPRRSTRAADDAEHRAGHERVEHDREAAGCGVGGPRGAARRGSPRRGPRRRCRGRRTCARRRSRSRCGSPSASPASAHRRARARRAPRGGLDAEPSSPRRPRSPSRGTTALSTHADERVRGRGGGFELQGEVDLRCRSSTVASSSRHRSSVTGFDPLRPRPR